MPNPESYDEQGQEFNRYTLMGEWDQLFFALLKERLLLDGLDVVQDLAAQFAGHLNRGVSLLYTRLKTLNDLHELIPNNRVQLGRETSNLDEEATLA
jgi:DNA sulfur modification protein DndE